MPYVVPTAADFKTRFPIFTDKTDPQIEALIVEAHQMVDESWEEGDFAPAILYLTAHLIAMDNSQADETVEIGGAAGAIASESFGGMSISYERSANAGRLQASEEYGQTVYGRRFLSLLRRNRGGPLVV